jgi:dTDP-glucose 4,6-dehydratase
MKRTTVVVTGGAGFIGSHLCARLLGEGYKVICLDNLITGVLDNLAEFRKNKNFDFLRCDVTKYINIRGRVGYVLHLASLASPKDYLELPIQTLKSGSLGTHNALGLAKEKKAKFLLASTSEVYGDPLLHPQTESYWGNVNCVGVRGCYDESKRFAEALTMAYYRMHKVNVGIARIFNTYGPRMRLHDGRVVPNFIYQALTGLAITVYGQGKQTRSFCYIDDLVEGLFRLMRVRLNSPLNLGNPREFTILELAQLINALAGAKSQIIFRPLPVDDPQQRQPDISLAKKALNWQPKVQLANGLARTTSWFREKIS